MKDKDLYFKNAKTKTHTYDVLEFFSKQEAALYQMHIASYVDIIQDGYYLHIKGKHKDVKIELERYHIYLDNKSDPKRREGINELIIKAVNYDPMDITNNC